MFWILRLRWRRRRAERSYDKKRKALKKQKADPAKFAELATDEYCEINDIDGGIDYAISNKLLDEARGLDVNIPGHDQVGVWINHEDGELNWLSPQGRTLVRRSIDEEKTRRRESKAWWWKTVIIPAITALTGLAGVITGLIAIMKK
ncbi:MAG TPA: hypothetical protein VFO46_04690 [Candidatus Sulfotelmatobacter sp.]|nr:hypothetical protein [Candidatus Sulfotelmatobacter sp.]